MNDLLPPKSGLPAEMTIMPAGRSVVRPPDGIASAPFRAEMLLSGTEDGEPTAMRAAFDPGVRTHWHSHPCGQILFVLAGVGLVQRRGGPIVEVRAEDTVWFAPGEVHWHGASEGSVFRYLSVQAVLQGRAADWFGPVS